MPSKPRQKPHFLGFKAFLLSVCLSAAGTYGCSEAASDDENLETSDNTNKGDLGGDDANEGNGQENYVDDDEGKNDHGGADANSATGQAANPAATDGNGNLLGADGAGNAPANAAPSEAPPLNTPPANATANAAFPEAPPANVQQASAPAAAPAAASVGANSPISGGRVRYVKDGGIQAVSAPNGSPVATLEQGDHPVTWEENGWLKINSGMYVPSDGMSNSGVARPQSGGGWAH